MMFELLFVMDRSLKTYISSVLTSETSSLQYFNHRIEVRHTCKNQTVPYGTVPWGWRCPRHFVPGYDRTVPPGTKAIRPSGASH